MGAAVALPLLESMSVRRALAAEAGAEAGAAAATRMAFVFVPNGMHMQDWTPKEAGKDFELPPILQSLAPVKDKITVFSGLAHDKARANGDGPGDHARSAATYLTASQARKTHGSDIKVGVSIDQVAAEKVGDRTRFPSLELGIDRGANSGNCDSGYSCAYSANISWKTESQPNGKEVDPRAVFERLFGGGDKSEREQRRNKYRQSILDFVQEDARKISGQVSAADRRKLDEYLTSVREIETRIQDAEKKASAGPPDKSFQKPEGIPDENAAHIKLMFDLLALSFQADATRIATFMLANEGSNRSYPELDVSDGHHSLSHHGNDKSKQAQIAKINTHHVQLFAEFLEKLNSTQDGEGSLLDHSMILYGCAIGDGNAHNHDKLPILLAGSGRGAVETGRHVRLGQETPVANLFLSMLDVIGAPIEEFGDSSGKLALKG
jgi:hypothetical protein